MVAYGCVTFISAMDDDHDCITSLQPITLPKYFDMKTSFFFILVFLSIFISDTRAQDMNILKGLSEEEENAIEAIALYPAKEREAILEASLHPEILVRMENIRSTTEAKFKETISGLAEANQKKIYNLSRYPDLITKICAVGDGRSNTEMADILKSYPEEIHADALFSNQNYFSLLREVNNLYMGAEEAFQTVLSTYPEKVREAYRQLDQLPGVTSILTDNMKMTVLLGDLYSKQPMQIMKALDSLNVVVAEQQASDLKDWKQKLEEDPAAMTEYENAAEEFASDEPYDDDVYDGPLPERYSNRVVVHEVWRPYQYWFGWPSWYADECWYPYPLWYHSGFYYGPGHKIVIIGLPSNVFFNWHFHHDSHFYHYPHFTDQIIRHYYGPRNFGSHVQPVIKRWEEDHRSELPDNWFNDDKNRANRIREYGKFKMDYDKKVGVKTEKSPTEREFLEKNANRYPTLKPVLTEKPESPRTQPTRNQPTRNQDNKSVPEYKPVQNDPRDKVTPEEKIDRAKENHENVWDNQRKPPKQESPSTAPVKRDQQNNIPRTEPALSLIHI